MGICPHSNLYFSYLFDLTIAIFSKLTVTVMPATAAAFFTGTVVTRFRLIAHERLCAMHLVTYCAAHSGVTLLRLGRQNSRHLIHTRFAAQQAPNVNQPLI